MKYTVVLSVVLKAMIANTTALIKKDKKDTLPNAAKVLTDVVTKIFGLPS